MLTRRSLLAMPVAAAAAETLLFDGTSSAGWVSVTGEEFPRRCWRIEDGCLRAFRPASGAFQDIRTQAEFGAFELTFEWKMAPGGNSGIKYSLNRVDTWKPKDDPDGLTGLHARARGLEFQLGDAATPDNRRGALFAPGALYGLYPAEKPAAVRPGEFNSGKIVYTPERLKHWINDALIVSADPSTADFAARIRASKDERLITRPRMAPIALQNHSSDAWFRNLRLRLLG